MSAIVPYSEYEAYKSNWRYLMERDGRTIDIIFTSILFLYITWFLYGCYRSYCAAPAAETPMDKKRLRNELVNIEHAIAALNEHRTCLMLKLKRD